MFTVNALNAGKCNSHHCLLVGRSKIVLQGGRKEGLEIFECFVGTNPNILLCTHEAFKTFMTSPAHSKPQRQDHARLKQDPDARAKEIR